MSLVTTADAASGGILVVLLLIAHDRERSGG